MFINAIKKVKLISHWVFFQWKIFLVGWNYSNAAAIGATYYVDKTNPSCSDMGSGPTTALLFCTIAKYDVARFLLHSRNSSERGPCGPQRNCIALAGVRTDYEPFRTKLYELTQAGQLAALPCADR